MALKGQLWRGVLQEYLEFMPKELTDPESIVTLQEGGTPLIRARAIENILGQNVQLYLKFEGANPTGSFKDRGMSAVITDSKSRGAKTVICASTGNTSASAAAYCALAGLQCCVLIPQGKIAMGKLAQAIIHGAKVIQIDGSFDDCLVLARQLAQDFEVALVNSINPARMQGQKTAAFEIVDQLGRAPDIHCIPVGNAGNITAYWMGFQEYFKLGKTDATPKMWGFQAQGAAPLVDGHIVEHPETIATAIRIGNPARSEDALKAVDQSQGLLDKVSDSAILDAQKLISSTSGLFCEPASAAPIAGLIQLAQKNQIPTGSIISATLTGHGLKDSQWALVDPESQPITPVSAPNDLASVAKLLGLTQNS